MTRSASLAHRLLGLAAKLVLLTSGQAVHAAELEWRAPSGCPDRDLAVRRIRDAVGRPLEQAAAIHFVCEVSKGRGGTYRVELRALASSDVRAPAPRIIEAETCEQAAEAAAVAIALALGETVPQGGEQSRDVAPLVNAEKSPHAPAQPANPEISAPDRQNQDNPKPETRTSPRKPPADRTEIGWSAQLGPSLDLGTLPGMTPGIAAGLQLGFGQAALRVSLLALSEKRRLLGDGTGGDFSLMSAAIDACARSSKRSEQSRAMLCGGIEVGQLKGVGAGQLLHAQPAKTWWAAPRMGLELASAPWLLGMRGFVGIVVGLPLTRRQFTLSSTEVVHRASSVFGRLNAGLEIDW